MNRRLRLTIFSSYFPSHEQLYRGRTAYHTALELREWMEVEAICPRGRYPNWLRPKNFPYQRTDLRFSPAGIKTTYIEYPAVPGLTRAINGLVCAHYCERSVAISRPDILQSYWLYPDGYAAVRIGRRLGIAVVLVAIGSDLNRIPDPLTRYFTAKALSGASFVMTMGRHLQQQAISLGADPKRTLAIVNGCDPEIFHWRDREQCRTQLGFDSTAPLVLYVGRLEMNKGVGELLEAVALLKHRSNLRLAFIGEGPAKAHLKYGAAEAGISSNVIFPDAPDSLTVALWLGACSIFALPSHGEGSPNVIVEALNCGRPVVATEVGGIPEMFDSDAGILIPARDSAALARAIDSALDHQWDETAIATRYRRSWRNLAEEMRTVLVAEIAGATAV